MEVASYLNYVKLEPYEGGCVFTRVNFIDLGGGKLSLTKRKGLDESKLAQPEALINFILNGYNI